MSNQNELSKKQLATSKAYVAQLENKCKELEDSNKIRKGKILILEKKGDRSADSNTPKTQHASYGSDTSNVHLLLQDQRILRLELENIRNTCRMDSLEQLLNFQNLTKHRATNHKPKKQQNGSRSAKTPQPSVPFMFTEPPPPLPHVHGSPVNMNVFSQHPIQTVLRTWNWKLQPMKLTLMNRAVLNLILIMVLNRVTLHVGTQI